MKNEITIRRGDDGCVDPHGPRPTAADVFIVNTALRA
jgi:hypothetical protein